MTANVCSSSEITRLEELSLNAWPSPRRVVMDGWILQFTGGFSGRANSIHPLYSGGGDLREQIGACERRYAEAGLPPMFKITPATAPRHLPALLAERGYEVKSGALVQTANLDRAFASFSAADRIWDRPDDLWVTSYASFRNLPTADDANLRSILKSIALPAHFAAVLDDRQEIIAVGLAVREGESVGLFDIIVRADVRRHGYGRRIVEALLGWATREGAVRAYLQVADQNLPAISLYASLGFSEAYMYQYYVKALMQEEASPAARRNT